MPAEGFTSITVTKKAFDLFDLNYQTKKQAGELPPGIFSFSSYFVYRMTNEIEEKNALRKFALKIKIMPTQFLDPKHLIKTN